MRGRHNSHSIVVYVCVCVYERSEFLFPFPIGRNPGRAVQVPLTNRASEAAPYSQYTHKHSLIHIHKTQHIYPFIQWVIWRGPLWKVLNSAVIIQHRKWFYIPAVFTSVEANPWYVISLATISQVSNFYRLLGQLCLMGYFRAPLPHLYRKALFIQFPTVLECIRKRITIKLWHLIENVGLKRKCLQ